MHPEGYTLIFELELYIQTSPIRTQPITVQFIRYNYTYMYNESMDFKLEYRRWQKLSHVRLLPQLDTLRPRSYILWISSRYSVKDSSGMEGLSSTTSPILSFWFGSVTGSWFSLGLSSSFKGKLKQDHLGLPLPLLSNKSITVEFCANSCTDICY